MKSITPYLLLTLCISSCNSDFNPAEKHATVDMAGIPQETEAAPETREEPAGNSERATSHIIKTAHVKFQVENVEAGTKHAELTAKQYNAFVAGMDMTTSNTSITNKLVVRVPSKDFDGLLESLGKEALFINYKKISTEDVTEEFIDIQSRLQTKKEVRDRYIDILKNKAKTVDDVLKAEQQIRIIQEEIEAKEGRLRYLQNRVSMSTIHLEIYQKVNFTETPEPFEKSYMAKVKQGFFNGWDIVTTLALFIINIWPLALVGIVVAWKRKWIRRKLSAKNNP